MPDKELVEYFIERTDERFIELKDELTLLHTEIKKLNEFKWRIAGMASMIYFIAIILFEACKFALERAMK